MDVVHIQRFVAAADYRHFRRAADHLNVTQPSLTRSIQLLESILDVQLFDRGPRGVTLTVFGEAFLPHARSLINDRERAVSAIQEIKGLGQGQIRVAVARSFVNEIVPSAIMEIIQKSPHIVINIIESHIPAALDLLREGSLDLCFGLHAPWLDQTNITFDAMWERRLFMVGRASHPLAGSQENTLEALAAYPWIIPDEDELVLRWRHGFERLGIAVPASPIRTSSFSLLRSCLLAGDFVSPMEQDSMRSELKSGQLVVLRKNEPESNFQMGVFSRSGRTMTPVAQALIAAVQKAGNALVAQD
jgi:DNA-binding transcriptional LysR family regulator